MTNYNMQFPAWEEYIYDGAKCECCGHPISVDEDYCEECKEAIFGEQIHSAS